jgi:hypothetical protein
MEFDLPTAMSILSVTKKEKQFDFMLLMVRKFSSLRLKVLYFGLRGTGK